MTILAHLAALKEEIASAAKKAHRSVEEIHLVIATKTVPWEKVVPLYDAGERHFAESRIQEALEKIGIAPSDVQWHFIGHLQKNKISKALGKFALIHSVDSLELAEALSRASKQAGIQTAVLLQANTSGELSKGGLSAVEWKKHLKSLLQLDGIDIQGLMTMAPLTKEEDVIRKTFSSLRFLRDELRLLSEGRMKLPFLSMGMSRDFHIAIEEGATHLRIGTALFHDEKELD